MYLRNIVISFQIVDCICISGKHDIGECVMQTSPEIHLLDVGQDHKIRFHLRSEPQIKFESYDELTMTLTCTSNGITLG